MKSHVSRPGVDRGLYRGVILGAILEVAVLVLLIGSWSIVLWLISP